MITYSDFAEKMLIALYQEAEADHAGQLRLGEIARKYGIEFSDKQLQRLTDEWERNGYATIDAFIGSPSLWYVDIKSAGMRYIEKKYGGKTGVGIIIKPVLPDVLSEISGDTGVSVPASDRIVHIDHNQIKEVETSLSGVINDVERTNGDPNDPTFRQRVLGQLRAGLELLRAGEFKAYLLQVTLVSGLNEIIKRYADSIIAGLATNLLQYIFTHGLSGR